MDEDIVWSAKIIHLYEIAEIGRNDLSPWTCVQGVTKTGITDINEASQSIISTMKAFNIEAEDSISIVDKFNETGNRYAISSKGIGDALQRSAAALAQAGNDLNESIGLIVGGNAVVQDPDVVGKKICPAA